MIRGRLFLAAAIAVFAWFLCFTFEAEAAWTAGITLAGAGLGWVLGGRKPGATQGSDVGVGDSGAGAGGGDGGS
jgi:hypothetical protein